MKTLQRILYYFCVSCRPNKSRTVRFAFPLVFVSASFLGAAALLFDDQSYIRIDSTDSVVQAGDNFSINVYVGAHVAVNAVDITLQYPDDQIEIDGIDIGESVITLWTEEPFVEGNTVVMSGGTFRKGFIGEHLIATINATALESGKAEFITEEIQLLAGDGTGGEITVSETGEESLAVFVENEDGTIAGDVTVQIVTDIDGDGNVGIDDVMAFVSAWGDREVIYDFNNDRRMNFTDFSIILADSFLK